MPRPPVPGLNATSSRLALRLGVTRVARVTGLDRTGVEVAAAIRPDGHVLQVTNGKALDYPAAVASALGEAAELWASEQLPLVSAFGSAEEARALTGFEVLGGGPARRSWVLGARLDGAPVLVGADEVSCPPLERAPPGLQVARWTSNGLGAHPLRAHALAHAALEVWEREALCRTLPGGWTPPAVSRRRRSFGGPLARTLERGGYQLAVFDLTPPGGAAPVAGALLAEADGPVPLTAGYAARPTWRAAALAAVLEAAQSRLTEIHGAREDVLLGRRREAQSARPLFELPAREGTPRAMTATALLRAWRRTAVVVELAPGRLPLSVLKLVVPGARVSELLT
ncbi:MAG: YcaO-like family protein [Myxococcaceae bacterium]|nr:YcaO-like family protein [Myxococcaceae bacterium]